MFHDNEALCFLQPFRYNRFGFNRYPCYDRFVITAILVMTVSLKRCCIASHIILCVALVACLIEQMTDWWNHCTIGSLVLWMIDWFIDGGIAWLI